MKKWIHAPYYNDVEVTCICGANFKINATVPGPIKVETCYQCHPAFNENKEVKKVIKGRMEKFLEKQKNLLNSLWYSFIIEWKMKWRYALTVDNPLFIKAK